MVDYILGNNSGVLVTIRTDAVDQSLNFFTIAQIIGLDNAAAQLAFNSLRIGQVIDKKTLLAVANANSFNMVGNYIGSNVAPVTHVQQTLPTPGTFTATPVSGGKMNLLWVHPSNGQQVVIDRATNVGFTTGVTLNRYTGSSTTFQDTGLTAATTYYYRLRSKGTLYADSAYATVNATAI